MAKQDGLTQRFESARHHLHSVAYRMLGSNSEAEDAVQEAWLRLNRIGSDGIDNLGGWLTTVVARVCLDMLRARKASTAESLEDMLYDAADDGSGDPESHFLIADTLGPALLLVLDTLTPTERIAFVLHDLFDLPFDEIAPIIDRTEAAARQLASRARRRVRGGTTPQANSPRQHAVVVAFLAASREGNFDALINLLHPDIILRADDTAIKISSANKAKGAPAFKPEITGAKNVADTFKGRAAGAQLTLVNGAAGATWGMNGKTVVAFCFTVKDEKITAIDVVMDRKTLDTFSIKAIVTPAIPNNNGV
ncbi:sigma-70 family RNA polymerase sigma factor [Cellvibrio sp. ARAG 10.3]|uniref:sigma-70 family RNA polymerase sigma factor n=1 Tax=Cellvibrio sp. ARAG 10.3 TaxID=3451358 RepID=UPI003F46D967